MDKKIFSFFFLLPLFLFGLGNISWGQVTISSQDFETNPATPTLTYTTNSGGGFTSGQNTNGRPATNLFASGAQGWGANNTTSTLIFTNQSLTGYSDCYIDFRLGGFSKNTSNGIDAADTISVYISTDGGTNYSLELRVGGNGANQYWDFSATGTATITYDGDNSPTLFSSSSGSAGISTVTINIPDTIFQVRIKIAMRTNDAQELYVIDDVRIRGTSNTAIPTIQASNITFSNVTTTSMTIGWTNGNGAKRIAKINTSNSFTAPTNGTNPKADSNYSGSGEKVVYNGSSNSVSVTGLSANTTYWFRVYEYNGSGTGTKYLTSTATNNPNSQTTSSTSYDANSYVDNPATQVNPGSISSLVTTDGQAVEVYRFKITDVGGDAQPTKVTQVTINSGSNNTADWSTSIQGAKLSTNGGSNFITIGSTTINASSMVFTISAGNLNISNGSSTTVSLYIYLKSSGLTDNKILQFNIPTTSHGFTADGTGSTFASTFNNAVTSNQISISVVATKLIFSTQPSNTVIGVNMSPAVTVSATDANSNTDLDFTENVSITSTGTLSVSPITVAAVSGVATFSTINHTATGTDLTLTASSSGLTDATSNTFNITAQSAGLLLLEENFDYTSGDKLTNHGWTAHSGSGTNPISVGSTGLTYDNYGSTGIGNSAILNNSGEDVNKTFTQQNSGSTTYAAFLVNVTSAQSSGDYIVHFGPSTISSEYRCRFFIRKDASGNLNFGISTSSNTETYSSNSYSTDTTYLIVIKQYFDASSQISSLYINPSLYSEPTPDVTQTNSGISITNIGSIALRQGSASSAPTCYIDGIRVGTGWGAVLGNPQYNGDENIAAGNYNNVTLYSGNLSLTGNANVRGTLNFNSGKVKLGDNTLTLSSSSGITGFNSTNYVITDGTGKLKINSIGNSEVTFPIGTTSSYNPVYLTNAGASDNFSAKVKSGFTVDPPDPTRAINREWDVSEDVTGGSDVTLRFQFNEGEANNNFILNGAYDVGHYEGSTWVGRSATITGTSYPYTINVSGINSFSSFAVGNQGAMPVTLQNLTSNVTGRNISLKWLTSQEINNAGFDVERKSGTGDFTKIGFVNGKGTVNTASSYEFTDRNLQTGKYSYRLKQIDNNGNFEYFSLSSDVIVGVPTKFDLSQNYPNPFNPTTKINFDLPKDAKVSMKLYDMLGREVATLLNEFRTAGYYTVDFNAANLSSGIYFYRISAGSYNAVKKLVLIK